MAAQPHGRRCPRSDALLALALLLLLRCVLDTWDAVYYPLPFVLALLAWEVGAAGAAPPVLALAAQRARVDQLPVAARCTSPPDAQAAFFLAWSLPLAAWLGLRLFSPARAGARPAPRAGGAARRAQEMTVSALGRLVRTS